MNNKKVIIIGAGIAGLSAGCYLQMNGYSTEIFELHNIPGGLCTGWKRKGYTFDGCIHWLCGSKPGNELHTIWEELGALQGKTIVDHEIFNYIELENGDAFSVYSNADALEKEMLRFAPGDEAIIKDFIKAVRTCRNIDMPALKAQELYGVADGLKLAFKGMGTLRLMNKWGKVPIEDFEKRFTTPLLNQNFAKLFGMPGNMPMFALIFTLALLDAKNAGYPVGGSLEFARSIEKRYISLGGKIRYGSRVEKILHSNGKAVGIRLADNSEQLGDIVISAADGHYTIYNMLNGKFLNDEIEGYYKNYKLFPPIIQVSLGIARKFEGIPDAITLHIHLKEKLYVDPQNTRDELSIKIYSFDPTLAPGGKTALVTFFEADYDYWVKLKRQDPQKYSDEKERVAKSVIAALEARYGGIEENIEVIDVATPDTYVRYTNNWMGSFEGFLPTVDNFMKNHKKTLPGLENFYMIGQWVQPGGGLPTGAMHGRHLTQLICKKDGKKFESAK